MNQEREINEDLVIRTKALRLSIKNYFKAFFATPIGKEYPLPSIGTYVSSNIVDLGKENIINIIEPDEGLTPGEKVIVYKNCMTK